MRLVLVSMLVCLLPAVVAAQDGEREDGPDAVTAPEPPPAPESGSQPTSDSAPASDSAQVSDSAPASDSASDSAPTPVPLSARPKVVLVVVGDPDPVLVAAAVEVEAHVSVSAELRLPADAALRAALRGDAGVPDDGLDEVRRERRRLGLGESSDAPVLARLGRRAGAVLVVAIREGGAGPEAVGLDVRSAQFFDGALSLDAPEAAATERFVARRAQVSARGGAQVVPEASAAAAATTEPPQPTVPPEATQADEEAGEPDWFEQNWPYFAAGGLLAAAIVFVVVTATDGGDPPPMLRFQPPGAQ